MAVLMCSGMFSQTPHAATLQSSIPLLQKHEIDTIVNQRSAAAQQMCDALRTCWAQV